MSQHPFFFKIGYRWLAMITLAFILLQLPGCDNATVENLTDYSGDSLPAEASTDTQVDWLAEPAPPIDSALLAKLQPCDGFDYPVAPPDAQHYFKARGFLPVGLEHLGEDWNGPGGGNTDFGDYVYAAADGVIFFSKYVNPGWGNVIRIIHNYGTEEAPRYVETLYAHVSSSLVHPGYAMRRGDVIGTIGNAAGKYHAHLHFEMRTRPGKGIRCGYDGDTLGFLSPTPFIEAHRPHQRP
jgi:murein DD-endopeptidase MepM/ murein hydrolase activator NlpD